MQITPKFILENGEILTIANAKIGMEIICSHRVSKDNEPYLMQFVIGKIVPAETLLENQDPLFIRDWKYQNGDVLEIVDQYGKPTDVRSHGGMEFTCTDTDRAVFFITIPTYEDLVDEGTLIDSALEGTCFLYEYKGVQYVVLQDNTVITRDEDNQGDPLFPY